MSKGRAALGLLKVVFSLIKGAILFFFSNGRLISSKFMWFGDCSIDDNVTIKFTQNAHFRVSRSAVYVTI